MVILVPARQCQQCGESLEGRSPRARFCNSTCRARHAEGRPPFAVLDPGAHNTQGAVERATEAALTAADRLDSPLGQTCLVLARRLDTPGADSGSGLAAVAAKLESLLASATRGTAAATAPQLLRDELAERRRRHGA